MAKQGANATQQIIEIDGVKNGVAILKNGALRQIIMVSGVNFDLKSEEEQGLITFNYQNFINGLNFPIQIFIHSRKLNTEGYLETLGQKGKQETNELLKNQISEYREFIKSFVSENAIMEKTFFVIVPFDPVQLSGITGKITKKLFGLLPTKKSAKTVGSQEEKEQQFKRHMDQLSQRVNQVISGLNQIGLNTAILNDEHVIELFYNLYNPEAVEKKTLEIAKE